jgi:hypothetical protein
MDAIYASAQLTLVAAVGRDSSYGLPGVSSARNFPVRQATVGSITLTFHPPACGWSVAHSPWFSRAWTLQEGYLSRRRLYFTDSEVLFVCNGLQHPHQDVTSDRYSGMKYLMGTIPNRPSQPHQSNLENALEMLTQYSARKLSYDSDALSAVTGILNHWNTGEHPVGSIWGVPFVELLGKTFHSKLCIHWKQRKPTTRRRDFPSWSQLGWHDPVEFSAISTQYTTTRDVVAKLFARAADLRTAKDLQHDAKLLVITARVFRFPIVHIAWPQSKPGPNLDPEEVKPQPLLPITDDTGKTSISHNLYVPIKWDTVELTATESTSALCAITLWEFVPVQTYKRCGIIILRSYAGYYERIGFAEYESARRSKNFDEVLDGFRNTKVMPPGDVHHWAPKGNYEVRWIKEAKEQTITLG